MLDLTQLRSAVRSEGGVSRRLFLAYSAALAATPLLQRRAEAADEAVSFPSNPFTLGVASAIRNRMALSSGHGSPPSRWTPTAASARETFR